MTNETIGSRIVDLVKGIFGQKAPAADKPEKTEPEPTADAEDTEDKADTAEPEAGQEAEATEAPQAEDTEEADDSDLVDAEDKDAIAEELDVAEAKTVTSSREPLDNAAAAAAEAAEEAAEEESETPADADLPVADYDNVPIASMRARLRKLSLDDVRTLRAYEEANANRPDFLKMYNNRITKVEKEG